MGLNDVYVVVQGNFLMTHPMPQIGQALSMVFQEERQRELQTPAPLTADSSAFLSQHRHNSFPPSKPPSQSSSSQYSSPSNRRPSLFCNYCRRPSYTIDRCFKLQRQRENSGPSERYKKVAANVHHEESITSEQNPTSVPSFTHEQYNKLLAMLHKNDQKTSSTSTSGDSTATIMLAGKVVCVSASHPGSKWIIDSGATDHITPNLHLFSSYSALTHDFFIVMPNGKHARIYHVGTIQLTPSLSLTNALYPDFHYNLLSVSKLVHQLTAHVIFSPDQCYIQVLQ